MQHYYQNDWYNNEELYHHGILGQKWGVRRFQNKDGTRIKTSKDVLRQYRKEGKVPFNAQAQNLDQWGKSPETNVLYISGGSGSGKSTVALKLKDDNTEVVHLDSYFDMGNTPNKDFDTYLKSIDSDHQRLKTPEGRKDPKVYERFEDAIESYGKDAYSRNKKVIVEGVQLLDDTVRPDKTYFRDKPFVMLNTNTLTSTIRADQRDDKKFSLDDVKRHSEWNKQIRNVKSQNDLHHTNEERGETM